MKSVLFILLALLSASPLRFDKTVHDFGTIRQKDGPQTCTFTVTNDSDEQLSILAVVSYCGCTGVVWTKGEIEPGKSGSITATYSNDEGPYAFDKKLSVYTSAQKKPVILHIKGEVVKK